MPYGSVEARITTTWPETERACLLRQPDEYPVAKAQAIQFVLDVLYKTFGLNVPTDVDEQPEVLQQYVADRATLRLMRFARDVYMQEVISHSANHEHSAGSSNQSGYNKLAALRELAGDLVRSADEAWPTVAGILG